MYNLYSSCVNDLSLKDANGDGLTTISDLASWLVQILTLPTAGLHDMIVGSDLYTFLELNTESCHSKWSILLSVALWAMLLRLSFGLVTTWQELTGYSDNQAMLDNSEKRKSMGYDK